MIRVVVDANVLISGLLSPTGPPSQVLDMWYEQRFSIITSEAIIAEFVRLAEAPRLRRWGMPEDGPARLLQALREFAVVTPGALHLEGVARDPNDDKYLACAVEGGADFLVSGDADLTSLGSFRGVRIVSSAELLRILAER